MNRANADQTQDALLETLVQQLNLDPAGRERLKQNLDQWDGHVRDLRDELLKSEAVTEADLAVRINVRDDC